MAEQRCESCRYWSQSYGENRRCKRVETGIDMPPRDGVVSENYYGYFITGPEFGCIHHSTHWGRLAEEASDSECFYTDHGTRIPLVLVQNVGGIVEATNAPPGTWTFSISLKEIVRSVSDKKAIHVKPDSVEAITVQRRRLLSELSAPTSQRYEGEN